MKKAFVLLSGGIDSTTCLHQAIKDFAPPELHPTILDKWDTEMWGPIHWVEAVSINYGQRHIKETEYAAKTCARFGIQHTILDLKGILGGAMLTDASIEIPNISYSDIKGVSPTYVPFRNGTLLSLITAHAQKWVNEGTQTALGKRYDPQGANQPRQAGVYFGAHAEDAANWAYPDCTPEFIGAMANAIFIGSYQAIRLYTPLQWFTKKEIIQKGESLGVNWKDTWSCYAGNELHCGTCPTCRARKTGFFDAGVADPTEYAA